MFHAVILIIKKLFTALGSLCSSSSFRLLGLHMVPILKEQSKHQKLSLDFEVWPETDTYCHERSCLSPEMFRENITPGSPMLYTKEGIRKRFLPYLPKGAQTCQS